MESHIEIVVCKFCTAENEVSIWEDETLKDVAFNCIICGKRN